ncbi:SPX domain protein involved in polyphosphate accumulation [Clostridium pascui]|uniref:polyphosphate polymerase domain-containing protein n=1 Tax=Clostridium pascui TaxID=46609 RepID=UPI00195677CB|nr:polyphosphate polymerase domain-containing protein [Clostridium pascui]MBM7871542.1 SPX domain protein involved in polyphosphate accumulation [Clostridium pascui]
MKEMIDVFRKEKKYIISQIASSKLYQLLSQVLHEDVHNSSNGGYMVRSLYFDTIDNTDYTEKEEGYEYRKKVRLRIYSPSENTAKLELKEKMGDSQRKRSLTISKEDALMLIAGRYECLLAYKSPFAEEMYFLMVQQLYMAKCIVEYNRTAFYVPENDIRITLDARIAATENNLDLFDENINLYPVSNFDDVTLEVKYNGFLLSYVRDLLATCNKMATSNSKYCLARSVSQCNGGLFT